ncbi:MAG: copper ion binding protein [Anaerolineaceae bacterium]|nr:copper ion binding protein [Anaerolineaceae bacterium]
MSKQDIREMSLSIGGMSCAACALQVEAAIHKLPGVTRVVVDLADSQARITYDPNRVDLLEFLQAVTDAGYPIPTREVLLDVGGMSCLSCVAHVEGALTDLAGVTEATVHLKNNTARVQYLPSIVTVSQMKQAIQHVGFAANER